MEQLKKGYKYSELGIIPVDWEVKKIGQEIDLLTGFPFPSSGYTKSGIRLLRCSNVKRGVIDWSEDLVQYWPSLTSELKFYLLNEGDIVIAMDGSLVGRSFARLSLTDLPAILLQRVARIRSQKIDMGYLKEFICSNYFTKYCDTVKTSSAIPHISAKDIKGFTIPVPSTIIEQNRIANALNDMDSYVRSIDIAIAKKRLIKQAVIQELLGAQSVWPRIRLGDVAMFYKGKGLSKSVLVENGVYKCIHYGELFTKYNEIIRNVLSATNSKDSSFLSHSNDVLMPTSDVTPNGLATASYLKEDNIILGGDILVIRAPKTVLNGAYLSYYISFRKNDIMKFVTGSTVFHLYAGDMKNFEFHLPSLSEQTRIVEILSDMDEELLVLEQTLEKAKQMKLGMMQELLTGKTRLI